MLLIDLTPANVVPVALGYGFASALVPVINAELFAAAAVAVMEASWWLPVVALAVGQTTGKIAMFLGARHGVGWLQRRHGRDRPSRELGPWRTRLAIWSRMMLELLDRPVQSFGVVLASSAVGIPPLAIVAIVAGTRKTPLPVFVIACLIGRVGRFLAIAWPIAIAAR